MSCRRQHALAGGSGLLMTAIGRETRRHMPVRDEACVTPEGAADKGLRLPPKAFSAQVETGWA
jgi:hypothetical protein